MNNTFLQYDKETGEYLGTRRTSKRFPLWSKGIIGRRIDDLPKDIIKNPENYKLKNNKIVKSKGKSKKDVATTIVNKI